MKIESILNLSQENIKQDKKEVVKLVLPTVNYKLIQDTVEQLQIQGNKKSYTIDLYA